MSLSHSYKCLAKLEELNSEYYKNFMKQLNNFAFRYGIDEHVASSRMWEYPWIWSMLEPLKSKGLRVLDVGSELSPFPWFLATQGFDVIVSDVRPNYWWLWNSVGHKLNVSVNTRILDAQDLDLPSASIDIYLSVSVIEHVLNKLKVITEASRILRPGGLLIMTFDICESGMGMAFPEWNGRALAMYEFDELFKLSSWFEPGLSEFPWNTKDIPEYLSWHRSTAAYHNYVTGAAIVQRNKQIWNEPFRRNLLPFAKRRLQSTILIAIWYFLHILKIARGKIHQVINLKEKINFNKVVY